MATFKNLSLAALLAVSPMAFGEPVDINTADAATLAKELNGVGEAKAQAIVAYREQHGPFQSVEELAMVDGIGEKTLAANKDKLTVSAAAKP
ncbi:MAG: helix-hairpin-helix domain-containing protein [Gammaproteobacteria bacterium]